MKFSRRNLKGSISLKQIEIEIANKSWTKIEQAGLYECGVSLMTRILIEHKEIKSLWRKSPNFVISEDEDNSKYPMLRLKENGIKIFEEIKEAVANLNDLKKVAIRFNDIGYQYYKLGARIEHIEICSEAFYSTIESVLLDDFKDKCKCVWIKIISYIELEIKNGMIRAETEI